MAAAKAVWRSSSGGGDRREPAWILGFKPKRTNLHEKYDYPYIEEFTQPDIRHCKFWFRGHLRGGELCATGPDAVSEHIVEAAWLSRAELAGKKVFPPALVERYWSDRAKPFSGPSYLGLRSMEFW